MYDIFITKFDYRHGEKFMSSFGLVDFEQWCLKIIEKAKLSGLNWKLVEETKSDTSDHLIRIAVKRI